MFYRFVLMRESERMIEDVKISGGDGKILKKKISILVKIKKFGNRTHSFTSINRKKKNLRSR